MDFTRLIQEMETLLSACETPDRKELVFRSHIHHTHRVMKWAERLLASETADPLVVMIACIFHDTGYSKTAPSGCGHAEYSAELLKERLFLLTPYVSSRQIESIIHCIRYHSRKEWLQADAPELTPELILLMEADLLDTCGPVALIRDAMAEGLLPDASFLRVYERMLESAPPYLTETPCHTPTACRYWKEQQDVHQRFLISYKRDLGLDLEEGWKLPYTQAFQYMQECMKEQDLVPNRYGVIFPFRKRSLHMERVAAWAYRFAKFYPDIDTDLLMVMAILHDIGYSADTDGITHAHSSVPLAHSYLKSHGVDDHTAAWICDMIYKHSDKSYLECDSNPLYFQLLLEADHMDETGAMSLCWDAMASMNVPSPSLSNTAAHIARFTLKMLHEFPMKTPEAVRTWKEKQQLVYDFYNLLIFSLEEFI